MPPLAAAQESSPAHPHALSCSLWARALRTAEVGHANSTISHMPVPMVAVCVCAGVCLLSRLLLQMHGFFFSGALHVCSFLVLDQDGLAGCGSSLLRKHLPGEHGIMLCRARSRAALDIGPDPLLRHACCCDAACCLQEFLFQCCQWRSYCLTRALAAKRDMRQAPEAIRQRGVGLTDCSACWQAPLRPAGQARVALVPC